MDAVLRNDFDPMTYTTYHENYYSEKRKEWARRSARARQPGGATASNPLTETYCAHDSSGDVYGRAVCPLRGTLVTPAAGSVTLTDYQP